MYGLSKLAAGKFEKGLLNFPPIPALPNKKLELSSFFRWDKSENIRDMILVTTGWVIKSGSEVQQAHWPQTISW
jgi:hypothetical protein